VSFLENPNTLRPALIRRMPKFYMTESEANTLAGYMLIVYQTPEFDAEAPIANASDAKTGHVASTATDVGHGKDLYYGKYACNSCHILDAKTDKGYIGPTLTGVGSRLTAAWIFHWLKDSQALRPGTLEPKWSMSDDDAASITAFLMRQNKTQGGHP
jgi:cytochrome c2